MPYYYGPVKNMAVGRGVIRGDSFFRKLGRGLGKVLKFAAPIAGAVLPFVAAGTLVGRGFQAARTVKRLGREIRTGSATDSTMLVAAGGMTPAKGYSKMMAGPTLSAAPEMSSMARVARTRRPTTRRAGRKRRRSTTRSRR